MIKNILNFKNFTQIRQSLNLSASNLLTSSNDEEKKKIKKSNFINTIQKNLIKKIKNKNLQKCEINKIKSIKEFVIFQESKNVPNQDKFNFKNLKSVKGKIFAIFDGYEGWQACIIKSGISFKITSGSHR